MTERPSHPKGVRPAAQEPSPPEMPRSTRPDVPRSSPPEVPRPVPAPPAPWALPVPTESRLANGIRVLTHHLPGQHVIAVRTVVPVSLADEPREHEGVTTMMARLLDEGAGGHTAEEFAELLERRGIALWAGVVDGGLTVDLDVPARFVDAAFELLTLALSAPVFPEEEVRRILRRRLAEIEQERASASHRAAREFTATLYAASERASRPAAGTPESIGALDRSVIARWFDTHVGPAGACVVVAGDLAGLDLGSLLERTLGTWVAPRHSPPPPLRAPVRAVDAARVVVVDRPGSVQSEIMIGSIGPDRRVQPGWAEHPVLAYVLGGSPTARIDAVLREEKGYTYGIRSVFRPRVAGGLFLTAGSVRLDVTGESVRLLLDLLEGMRAGVDVAEARAGVDFLTRTAPGRYATADALADESAGLALAGLPSDFTTASLRRLATLTTTELDAAWTRIGAEGWTVVIVTDASAALGQLEEAGVGPVAVVTD